jgi:hypothetical protein
MEYQVLVTFISQISSFTNVIVHFIVVQFLTKVKYSLPTVHDRGRGYSNSLKTSAEGYTLPTRFDTSAGRYPRIVIHQVCEVQIIKQTLSLAYSSIGSFPRSPRHSNLRSSTPSFARYRMLYEWTSPPSSEVSHTLGTSIKDDARYPILRQTSYGLSPFPFRGSVVVRYGWLT